MISFKILIIFHLNCRMVWFSIYRIVPEYRMFPVQPLSCSWKLLSSMEILNRKYWQGTFPFSFPSKTITADVITSIDQNYADSTNIFNTEPTQLTEYTPALSLIVNKRSQRHRSTLMRCSERFWTNFTAHKLTKSPRN